MCFSLAVKQTAHFKVEAQANFEKKRKKSRYCRQPTRYKNKSVPQRSAQRFSLSSESPRHEWHRQLFSYFYCISFKFPLCVLEMNIWSFPPEPVTDGPLKLGDTALCLWHCGIYRRKRSNSSAQREHEKVNTVSWWFTCLETLFVSNVLTTNVWGQQSCSVFAFLEMTVCFNVFFSFFSSCLDCVCSANAAAVCRKKTFPVYSVHFLKLKFFVLLRARACMFVLACVSVWWQ